MPLPYVFHIGCDERKVCSRTNSHSISDTTLSMDTTRLRAIICNLPPAAYFTGAVHLPQVRTAYAHSVSQSPLGLLLQASSNLNCEFMQLTLRHSTVIWDHF